MGRQVSTNQFLGNVGNVNGYSRAGYPGAYYVRKIPGCSRYDFLTKASMELTRQNATEFSGCSRSAGNFNVYFPKMFKIPGGRTYYNFLKKFHTLLLSDTGSPRGKRNITVSNPTFESLFLNTNISGNDLLSRINSNFYAASAGAGDYDISIFDPIVPGEINYPPGATHYEIIVVAFNFTDRRYNSSSKSYVPTGGIDSSIASYSFGIQAVDTGQPSVSATLNVGDAANANQSGIVWFGVRFYQYVDGNYIFAGGVADRFIFVANGPL